MRGITGIISISFDFGTAANRPLYRSHMNALNCILNGGDPWLVVSGPKYQVASALGDCQALVSKSVENTTAKPMQMAMAA
jgi:hypothetical protein